MDAGAETAGPLVGRARELERLEALLGVGAEVPGSSAVLVGGDAGVGKTRLLTELRRRATDAGWRTVTGHCVDFGDSAPPYLPFAEIFGRLVADLPALGVAIVEERPALGRLVPGQRVGAGGTGPDGPRMDRSDLFESVHAGLRRMATTAPLLVVVEDAHWADHSTREMLSFLFARPSPEPVAVVASYRSDDLHRRHPLRAAAGEWGRLPGVVRIQLDPLPDPDVRALVRALHPGPLPEARIQGIVARAEGNAFFVEELVAATERVGTELPTDLVDLLLVRVDRLDEPVRDVVRTAAVAGRRVSHRLLARVVDMDAATLERCLRTAVEANVLVAATPDAYAFRHALLAEAVYDDLLPGERVRLHAAYTTAIVAHPGEGRAADLARHARAAHDVQTALRASVEAGDEAMTMAGPAEAAHHYEHALGLLADVTVDADPPIDAVDLARRAGEASVEAGNTHRAVGLLRDQLAQLDPAAPALDRARLLYALAEAALQGDTGVDPLRATTEAVRLVPAEPPTVLRAHVVNMHARANADRRRDDEAARWAATAVDLGRDLQLQEIVADATTTLARVHERAGDPDASRRALRQALDDAAAGGDAAAELRALSALGGLHYTLGELDEAAEVSRDCTERARILGRPWSPFGLDGRVMYGIVAYTAGRWDDTLEVTDVADESPPGLAEALLGAVGLAVRAGRGDRDATGRLAGLRPWWDLDGQIAILAATAAIDLHGDRGALAEAIGAHDDVVACIGALWGRPTFPARIRLAGLLLGQLCAAARTAPAAELAGLAARGDDLAGAAEEAFASGVRMGHPHGVESEAWLARVGAERIRLRWLTGIGSPDGPELVAAWEDSVRVFERFGHRFETARSQTRLAVSLRATGRPEEATRLARAATETATLLRAGPLLDEIRAGVPGSARAATPSRHGEALTGREQEILTLLAVGRTNSDIGRQLYISGKTVSVHVSNLMAKLGARGRTEAVAIARRQGLLTDTGTAAGTTDTRP